MMLVNRFRFTLIYIFTVCFPVSTCKMILYPVCSFEGQVDSMKCRKGNVLSLNCKSDFIYITQVNHSWLQRKCDDKDKCESCCGQLTGISRYINMYISRKCNKQSKCEIALRKSLSYNVYYRCMPNQAKTTLTQLITATNTTTTNTQQITGSKEFPTEAVIVPVIIFLVVLFVIIPVVCYVKKRRQKKDETRGNNDQITSKTAKLVSNVVYTGDVLVDVVTKPSQSMNRTLPSTEDSAYTECQDVEDIDNDNGEYNTIETDDDNGKYNTIEINLATPNVDPAYSHLPKKAHMVDTTYSHIATEQNNTSATSEYSHLNDESVHSTPEDTDATYNTLQTHDINKDLKREPAKVDESENVYNIANFTSGSSKQVEYDTEYSHMNTNIKRKTNVISTEEKLILNDVEYVEVDNPHLDINLDSAHTYFVLEKGSTGAKNDNKEDPLST